MTRYYQGVNAERPHSCVIIVLGTLLLAAKAPGHDGYEVKPPASWVVSTSLPDAADARGTEQRVDVQQLLVDEQDHYSGERLEAYRHYARRISTSAGVQNVSDIAIEFDPGYQKLVLHYITLHRNGARTDALARSQIRTVNAQSDESARIYDDTVAVHVLLTDVRVGDTVEYAYTRSGENPVLRGHALSSFTLGRPVAVRRVRQRVTFPIGSAAKLKVHGSKVLPERKGREGLVEYFWSLDDVAAVEVEDKTPEWFDPYPWVQVSDFATWGDVAKWAVALYDKPAELGQELESRAATWDREPDAEKRLVQAVRFVQDEVRYLAVEVGPNSFEPHEPARVVAQRYGDCKDKSLLLVTLLRRLGIDAHPALVSSSGGPMVSEMLPSPYAFDHVIVRARIGQRSYFFDPTLTYQRGTAELMRTPDYGYALVIAPDTRALEKLDVAPLDRPLIEIVETYRLRGAEPVVDFQVETELRGAEAARSREHFASEGPARIQREYENFYAKLFPSVTATKPVQHVDDESRDTFKIIEHYRIGDFWDEGKRTVLSWAIRSPLSKPDVVKRKQPFAVQHPAFVRHTVIVDWDTPAEYAIEPLSMRSEALSFRRHGTASGGRLAMTYELRSLKDHVKPEEARSHFALVDRILDETAYELTNGNMSIATGSPSLGVWVGVAVFGGFLLAVGTGWIRSKRRRRAFLRDPGRGEVAATALTVQSRAEALRAMTSLRCVCGSPLADDVHESPDPIRFGDRQLMLLESRCERCGKTVKRYFDVGTAVSAE